MSDWQPIETAPRDGTAVLTWTRIDGIVIACCFGGMWMGEGLFAQFLPTHWQPLPAPPSEGEGKP